MEVVGKLFGIFLLSCTFGLGTVYVLEKGYFSNVETEDIVIDTLIDESLDVKKYRKKLRDEYHEFHSDQKLLDEIDESSDSNIVWKSEYSGTNSE